MLFDFLMLTVIHKPGISNANKSDNCLLGSFSLALEKMMRTLQQSAKPCKYMGLLYHQRLSWTLYLQCGRKIGQFMGTRYPSQCGILFPIIESRSSFEVVLLPWWALISLRWPTLVHTHRCNRQRLRWPLLFSPNSQYWTCKHCLKGNGYRLSNHLRRYQMWTFQPRGQSPFQYTKSKANLNLVISKGW